MSSALLPKGIRSNLAVVPYIRPMPFNINPDQLRKPPVFLGVELLEKLSYAVSHWRVFWSRVEARYLTDNSSWREAFYSYVKDGRLLLLYPGCRYIAPVDMLRGFSV